MEQQLKLEDTQLSSSLTSHTFTASLADNYGSPILSLTDNQIEDMIASGTIDPKNLHESMFNYAVKFGLI